MASENVRDGFLDISTPKFVPRAFHTKLARSQLKHGDLLINLVGASIGRSCRYTGKYIDANVNQAVCVFRPLPEYEAEWFLLCLQNPRAVDRLLGEQAETARANLSLTDVREFTFPVPSRAEQDRIVAAFSSANIQVDSESTELAKLRTLKQGPMDDLLTGRIRVNVEEAAE